MVEGLCGYLPVEELVGVVDDEFKDVVESQVKGLKKKDQEN